jgi:hypothetical protein
MPALGSRATQRIATSGVAGSICNQRICNQRIVAGSICNDHSSMVARLACVKG